jgi:hypothetical protein
MSLALGHLHDVDAEPLYQQPVTETAVACGQRLLVQFLHDRSDDGRAGDDDVRAPGLEACDWRRIALSGETDVECSGPDCGAGRKQVIPPKFAS